MNIIDLLPLEIILIIVLQLDRKSIKAIYEVSYKIKQVALEKLLKSRQINTFPRQTESSVIHKIPYDTVGLKDILPNKEQLSLTLKYLNDLDVDLVKGDRIIFDCFVTIYIFDGNEIRKISNKDFYVIENNVPIKYWYIDNNYFNYYSQHTNFIIQQIVYFNHSLVLDVCIKNLQYGIIEDDKYGIFTTFTFGDLQYEIIFIFIDSMNVHQIEILDVIRLLDKAKQQLICNKEIEFRYNSCGIYQKKDLENNILYAVFKC